VGVSSSGLGPPDLQEIISSKIARFSKTVPDFKIFRELILTKLKDLGNLLWDAIIIKF
jgi:hypothetical protein